MANKKRKQKQEVVMVEEVKGLPYSNLARKIMDYCVLGFCLITLLSLVVPVLRLWYPLSNNPVYTNFFTPGYAFIFGGVFKNMGTGNTTSVLTVKFNVRYFLSFLFIFLSSVSVGLGYIKGLKKNKKFLRLISSLLFAAAFVLIFNYNDELVKVLRSYKNISNTIKNIEFTVYGIIHLVTLGLGTIVMFYQACCEKIVKK